MWLSIVRSQLNRHTFISVYTRNSFGIQIKPLSTQSELNDVAEPIIQPEPENENFPNNKKIGSALNKSYFRSIVQSLDNHATSIKDSDLSKFQDKFNSQFIEKSNEFAKKALKIPQIAKSRGDLNKSKKFNAPDINPEYEAELHDLIRSRQPVNQNTKKYSKNNYYKYRSENSYETQLNKLIDSNSMRKSEENERDSDEKNTQKIEQNLKSKPRNWQDEIEHHKHERNERRIQKREFFSQQAQNLELNENYSYKLNRNKHRKTQIKEQRDDFKKKFLTYKKQQRINEIELSDASLVSISKNENSLNEEDLLEEDIRNLRPTARPFVYNLAYFVNDSTVLQTFIKMGIMIRKWDTDREICDFVLKLDLERDVKPRLIFLHDIKIPADKHAFVIQKNPYIFKEEIVNLETRVEYLQSKKFSDDEITEIITKAPRWLRLSVEQVDTKLGWLQNEFNLTGSQLREIIISRPKLVTLPLKMVADVRFCLKDFLNFDEKQIKHFIIKYPKLFTKDFQIIEANHNYLTRVIKLTNEQIATYAPILQVPLQLLRTRYSFLKHLNRIQFDVTQPNFISVKNMVEHDEEKFLNKFAKTTENEYREFLKTL